MRLGRRAVLAGLGVGLTGCGFHPLYAPAAGPISPAQLELAAVDVALIPDRPGQLLRQALQQRLGGPGYAIAKTYVLSVNLALTGAAIAIQQDTTPTRLRETATAHWSLKRLDPSSTLVTSGTARALDGLNVIDQQYFSSDLESQTIQKRLAETVADQITQQLAVYFRRQRTS